MKKAVFLVTTITILLFLLCSSALALDGQSGPYSYTVKKNGDLCITKFDWNKYGKEDVYIPKMIDGYTVTEIGNSAFIECNYEVVVIIPDTVSIIGEKAFFCTGITAMNIPSSVKEIGYGAFSGCKNLKDFSVDKQNTRYATIDGVLYDKVKRELLAFPGDKSAQYSGGAYTITIPEGIVSIAPYAFYYYYNIGQPLIILPSTLQSIGDHAFEYAYIKLTTEEKKEDCISHSSTVVNAKWVFPSSLENIGEYSFAHLTYPDHYANKIEGLDMSETSITVIPRYAFYGTNCYRFILPSKLENIEEYAFACDLEYKGLGGGGGYGGDLIIPKTVKTIAAYSFCRSRCELSFEENSSLEKLSEGAFYEAIKNDILVLPDSLKEIGDYAFYSSGDSLYSIVNDINYFTKRTNRGKPASRSAG